MPLLVQLPADGVACLDGSIESFLRGAVWGTIGSIVFERQLGWFSREPPPPPPNFFLPRRLRAVSRHGFAVGFWAFASCFAGCALEREWPATTYPLNSICAGGFSGLMVAMGLGKAPAKLLQYGLCSAALLTALEGPEWYIAKYYNEDQDAGAEVADETMLEQAMGSRPPMS
eukprot:g15320.t1